MTSNCTMAENSVYKRTTLTSVTNRQSMVAANLTMASVILPSSEGSDKARLAAAVCQNASLTKRLSHQTV